ncbi:hypothetical protein BDV24DRAFT_160287 [Aspergillus arachidicola]|uniref:Uncharacterized protein n=1 Tax=Aspergillus arachidicola TaxID=656916 RepID=A0A5N6YIZ1_9EURO|nr:hypothetical protein BDV24DRAFT_160287 [Aspergillus arachidicola]
MDDPDAALWNEVYVDAHPPIIGTIEDRVKVLPLINPTARDQMLAASASLSAYFAYLDFDNICRELEGSGHGSRIHEYKSPAHSEELWPLMVKMWNLCMKTVGHPRYSNELVVCRNPSKGSQRLHLGPTWIAKRPGAYVISYRIQVYGNMERQLQEDAEEQRKNMREAFGKGQQEDIEDVDVYGQHANEHWRTTDSWSNVKPLFNTWTRTAQRRVQQMVKQIMGAIFVSIGIDMRFADYKAAATLESDGQWSGITIPRSTPDVSVKNGRMVTLAVHEFPEATLSRTVRVSQRREHDFRQIPGPTSMAPPARPPRPRDRPAEPVTIVSDHIIKSGRLFQAVVCVCVWVGGESQYAQKRQSSMYRHLVEQLLYQNSIPGFVDKIGKVICEVESNQGPGNMWSPCIVEEQVAPTLKQYHDIQGHFADSITLDRLVGNVY